MAIAEQEQARDTGAYRSPAYAFWLVVTGIGAVVLIFVLSIIFFGLVRSLFTTPDQVIAALSTAFTIIGTLVGSYFGIKASGDARSGIEEARKDTQALADKVLDQAPTAEETPPLAGEPHLPVHRLRAGQPRSPGRCPLLVSPPVAQEAQASNPRSRVASIHESPRSLVSGNR